MRNLFFNKIEMKYFGDQNKRNFISSNDIILYVCELIQLYFCFLSFIASSFNCWFDSREYQKRHSSCRSFNISGKDFFIDKACELLSNSDLPLDSILLFETSFDVSERLLLVEVLVLYVFDKVEDFESFLIIDV